VKTSRSRNWSLSQENQELRSWSHVHEKKSCGHGVVTFLRWLRSPEIIHTLSGHTDDRQEKLNR